MGRVAQTSLAVNSALSLLVTHATTPSTGRTGYG